MLMVEAITQFVHACGQSASTATSAPRSAPSTSSGTLTDFCISSREAMRMLGKKDRRSPRPGPPRRLNCSRP